MSGELVSSEVDSAQRAPSEQVAARRGHLRGNGDGGGGVPGAAVGILTALGLLGAGALIEARGLGR